MKLLFSGDIHIKLGSKNVPIFWARNRFQLFVEQLTKMQESADMVVLGGDIFDRLPTMDEVELYFDLIASMIKPTIIYAGNHEALKKDTTFLTFLKKSTHRLNSLVTIIDDFCTINGVDFVPYNKLKELEKTDFNFTEKVLCTHVRGEIPPHVLPEIDLNIFNRWQTVLAGDLHSYQNSQRNILYPGSPYTTSFHRNKVDTGAILFDTNTHTHEWLKFKLPQLIKTTIRAGDNMPATSFDHTIYEVQGDMAELAELENSDLIDKKVIKRATEATLILDPTMTLSDEVAEYLNYILELPAETVAQVLKEMQNYADKFEQ